jgi:hypothetical protein
MSAAASSALISRNDNGRLCLAASFRASSTAALLRCSSSRRSGKCSIRRSQAPDSACCAPRTAGRRASTPGWGVLDRAADDIN